MQKKYHYGTVGLMLALYGTLLAGTIFSGNMNAFPKPSPETMVNGVWAQELELYLEQHIGFHDTLFRLKTKTDLLVGEKMIRGVYVTDEMLLERLDYDENGNYITNSSTALNRFTETYGIPTYLLLVPSASEIYESSLPANVVKEDQETGIRENYAQVMERVRCLDAYSVLSSLTDEYIYYRTDTHWTSYGAYCVYRSAIQKMGFTPIPYNRYVISHVSTEFRGDLYAKTLYDGVQSDVMDYYSYEGGGQIESVTAHYADGRTEKRSALLYDASALLSEEDKYRFYLGAPCEKLVIRTGLDNGKKLLLYKDDFADCFIPFLLEHYSEICVVDLERMGTTYETAADPAEYTQVLFLSSMEKWKEIWAAATE